MKSISSNIEDLQIINKSKFYTFLIKVENENEAKSLIKNFKTIYKDATHVCSAYICESHKKASDDGEPNGTAGMPILNILEKKELDHILCIVVRYFGGIKLGAGGLIRAYSGCVRKALEKTEISELKKGFFVTITFDYTLENDIKRHILDTPTHKKYEDKVTYSFKISEEGFNKLPSSIEVIKKENIFI